MAAVRLTIQGGPFDGGAVEVPRRTPPGLRLSLTSDDVTASYRITAASGGTCVVLFEEPSKEPAAADQPCSTAITLPAGSRNHAMSGPRPLPRTMPRSSDGNSSSL